MNNPNGRTLESKLVDFLLEKKGYPKDAIAQEAWVMSRDRGIGGTVDVAVVDPSVNDFIAFFEVKNSSVSETIDEATYQLMSFRKVSGVSSVAMFLIAKPDSTDFEFSVTQILPNGETKRLDPADLPSFQSLISGIMASERTARKEIVEVKIDRFKHVCFGLALFVTLLLVADITNWVSLTNKHLILGAAAIGLILLPFAANIKMLGVEFERYRPEKPNDDSR